MLDTGMRPEEVCRMSWEYVHLEPVNGARFGYLHNPKGKTKHAKRNLSLTARVQCLLSLRHEAAGKPAKGWVFPANDDLTMSQRYVHPTPERLEDAFARLETYNQGKVAATHKTESVAVN
jgi:integrase